LQIKTIYLIKSVDLMIKHCIMNTLTKQTQSTKKRTNEMEKPNWGLIAMIIVTIAFWVFVIELVGRAL